MATGVIKNKAPANDYEMLGSITWNGTTIECWRNGNCVSMAMRGTYTNAEAAGSKGKVFTIPSKYMPHNTVNYNPLFYTQNGKRLLMQVRAATSEIGLYYQLDAVAAGDSAYGLITWAAKGS